MTPALLHTRFIRSLFLRACYHLQAGELTLITPEKETWHFVGKEAGPMADITLRDWGSLRRLFLHGETAFAKDYVQGKWESETLPQLLTLLMRHEDFYKNTRIMQWRQKRIGRKSVRANGEVKKDFFQLLLDPSMTFSAALFQNEPRTLEQAQQAKYARILDRLENAKTILDIGCGWGGFMQAARKRGHSVRGITLSKEQADTVGEGAIVHDYRREDQPADAVVAIEMFEQVGMHFWPQFFRCVHRLVKPGGKAIMQTLFTADDLFPNGALPTQGRFLAEAEKAGFTIISVYRFGQDYAQTQQHWLNNLDSQTALLHDLGYHDHILRSWRFYLSHNIASLLTRRTDVMQVEFLRIDNEGQKERASDDTLSTG